jgi:hypothetical protein
MYICFEMLQYCHTKCTYRHNEIWISIYIYIYIYIYVNVHNHMYIPVQYAANAITKATIVMHVYIYINSHLNTYMDMFMST